MQCPWLDTVRELADIPTLDEQQAREYLERLLDRKRRREMAGEAGFVGELKRAAEALGLEVEPPNSPSSGWIFNRQGDASVGADTAARIEDFAHSLAEFLRSEEAVDARQG